LSFMLTNVVDLIDVVLVGRLGRDAIAAYGYSAQYLQLVQTLIQSVGIGCVALMARAIGARDASRAKRVLSGSVLVAQGIAWAATIIVAVLPRPLLVCLDAAPHVVDVAVPYFRMVMLSTVVSSVSFITESALRAHKLTRVPMMIMVVTAMVIAVANYALIFGAFGLPRLELLGAGISTLIAQTTGMVLYIVVARVASRSGLAVTFDLATLVRARTTGREVLRISLPAMGERMVTSLALLSYFAILGDYGTAAVAAYAIGVRLLAFSWIPGLGFATAAATFVGQALGAGDPQGARRAGRRALRLALLVMTGLGVACVFLRHPLAGVFTDDPRVIASLLPFLLMLAVAQPFMGVHFTLAGALRGAGDTVTPLIGAAIGNWGLRLPIAWFFAESLRFDLAWVWSALIADHFVRMLIMTAVFSKGRWVRRTDTS
jgi:putative MATE family efflux protein